MSNYLQKQAEAETNWWEAVVLIGGGTILPLVPLYARITYLAAPTTWLPEAAAIALNSIETKLESVGVSLVPLSRVFDILASDHYWLVHQTFVTWVKSWQSFGRSGHAVELARTVLDYVSRPDVYPSMDAVETAAQRRAVNLIRGLGEHLRMGHQVVAALATLFKAGVFDRQIKQMGRIQELAQLSHHPPFETTLLQVTAAMLEDYIVRTWVHQTAKTVQANVIESGFRSLFGDVGAAQMRGEFDRLLNERIS
ncbi:MAG: hypothetical protein IPM16_04780 [Chloroflexi bacterium]|nr:hypothetical protein [Chloroflexota bacterium]